MNEEIINESQRSELLIDHNSRTGWYSGHHVSRWTRQVEQIDGFRQFRSDWVKERQKEMCKIV
jgi:hypothetical protein